jgi:hypothetical protein
MPTVQVEHQVLFLHHFLSEIALLLLPSCRFHQGCDFGWCEIVRARFVSRDTDTNVLADIIKSSPVFTSVWSSNNKHVMALSKEGLSKLMGIRVGYWLLPPPPHGEPSASPARSNSPSEIATVHSSGKVTE